jgi:iron complex outermembrane receptor protein
MIAHEGNEEAPRRSPLGVLPALVIALALAAWAPGAALLAQETDEPDTREEAEEAVAEAEGEDPVLDAQQGEEIVVTARKREENLQEVPVAVTVTPGEVLEDTGAPDISVLQGYVPNLSVYAGRNQSTTLTAFMRGIGQADPLWGVDPGVGLYLDDVYIARPQGALLDVYDVERVEVLRGPQGTLYGKNTIGGAIKYVSRAPTDEPEARVSVAGGSYGTQNVRALLAGPLVEGTLRGKIAFASLQRDGYGENRFTGRDVSDKDSMAFRVALDWLPTEAVTVQLSADGTRDDAEPKGYQRLQANPFCPLFLGAPCPPLDDRFDTQSGLAPKNGTDSEGYGLTINWDLAPAWRFRAISSYRESDSENNIDFDTTPAPITDVIATYYDEQWSQELQLVYAGGGRLDGVFGVYYFDGEAGGRVLNNFLNLLFGSTEGFVQTESLALFGDGTYRLSDRLALNFGLRVTEEDKRGVAFNVGFTDATFTTINAVVADFDKSETFTSVAPRLGLDYQLAPDVMGYVSASRGFKSGGFNVRAQATAFPASAEPFDDEVLDVVEVGLKSILADRQLVLNTAAFYGEYTDIQVSTFTAFDSNGDGVDDAFFGNFVNAGDATMKGLEVEYGWNPRAVQWLGLEGHVSWLDAEPDSVLDENGDGFVDTQVITNAPEYTASLRLRFDRPAFGGLFTAVVGGHYRDESVLTNEGGADPRNPSRPLQPLTQDGYTTVDASLNWLSGDGTWGLKVNGYNLTDEEYVTNGYNIPVLGVVTGSYGPPATVVAGVEYRFF